MTAEDDCVVTHFIGELHSAFGSLLLLIGISFEYDLPQVCKLLTLGVCLCFEIDKPLVRIPGCLFSLVQGCP